MNVLCIGNSFSQDAASYVHQISDGEIDIYNLYIGGCTLERHYRNMLGEKREYMLEVNGTSTGFRVGMKEALLTRPWDVVAVQQQSAASAREDSFEPYLTEIVSLIRKCCPKTEIWMHQSWAYEAGSKHLQNVPFDTPAEMLAKVKNNYEKAAARIGAAGILPSGMVMDALVNAGLSPVYRDGLHASYDIGRWALGLMWAEKLLGRTVDPSFTAGLAEETLDNIRIAVKKVR